MSALAFDGSNDYVTMGVASGSARRNSPWKRVLLDRRRHDDAQRTGTGGLPAGTIPLLSKGRPGGQPANLNMNYFIGITNSRLSVISRMPPPA